MQSDDSGRIVMRKVPAQRRRPEWQDINAVNYKGGGSAARPQYMERRRPHRISVRTPESARDALLKDLDRAEAIAARAKNSPKKSDRQAADGLCDEIRCLRESLGSGRKGKKNDSAAGINQASENEDDLMASIDALSSVLDNKLAFIAEATGEQFAGTASSFVNGTSGGGMQAHVDSKAHVDSTPALPVGDYQAPSEALAPVPSEDDPVVRADVDVWGDDEDMCLHGDSVDEGDEALEREQPADASGAARKQGECGQEGGEGDEGQYDDDFETSLVAGDGEQDEHVSDEIVDKLNETHRKLNVLESLLAPDDGAQDTDKEEERIVIGHGGQPTNPVSTALQGESALESEAVAPEQAVPVVAPALVSRIASKPFSFKSKLGVGAGAGAKGGAAGKLMSFFASGPTMLNGEQNKAQEIQANAMDVRSSASSKPDAGDSDLGAPSHNAPAQAPATVHALAPVSQPDEVTRQACTLASPGAVPVERKQGAYIPSAHVASHVSGPQNAAQAPPAPAMGGGRAGRGLLNLAAPAPSDLKRADAAGPWPVYQPSSARAGRGLLDSNGDGGAGCGGHAPEVSAPPGEAGISRGTTASSGGSESVDGRREWTGGSACSDRERATSAGGKKKISKEEIRRAMLAAQQGAGPVGADAAPPLAAPVVPGRRRTADDEAKIKPVMEGLGGEVREVPPNFDGQLLGRGDSATADGDFSRKGGLGMGSGDERKGGASSQIDLGHGSDCQEQLPLSNFGGGRGRRGPVRATGPPRFAAGIGAEAKAAAAAEPFCAGAGEDCDVGVTPLGDDRRGARAKMTVSAVSAAALDTSLDRSLECEEL